jgi:hypothetical protein
VPLLVGDEAAGMLALDGGDARLEVLEDRLLVRRDDDVVLRH